MPAGPDILRARLLNQKILAPATPLSSPAAVVSQLCAMQAQDYAGVLWSVGLRMPSATSAGIVQSLEHGGILRTWLLRGTLHLVSPEDVRWILRLTGPRVMAGYAGRHRQLGLSADDFAKSREILARDLAGGGVLTRAEVFRSLDRAGISTEGQRGYHLLAMAGLAGLICFGPLRGKQQTFVLLDDRAPVDSEIPPGDPAAVLAGRYFTGHGPATAEDFSWWSGLSLSAARTAIANAGSCLASFPVGGREFLSPAGGEPGEEHSGRDDRAFLLPGFDEYIVGYRDRSTIIDPRVRRMTGGNGMMAPVIVLKGVVAGTWKRQIGKKGITLSPTPFRAGGPEWTEKIADAATRYGRFMGLPVTTMW